MLGIISEISTVSKESSNMLVRFLPSAALGACKPVHRCACCAHDARFSAWEGARRPLPMPSGRGRLLLFISASCAPPMGLNSPLMPGAAHTRTAHLSARLFALRIATAAAQRPDALVTHGPRDRALRPWAGVYAIASPTLRTLRRTSARSRLEARARCGRRGRAPRRMRACLAARAVAHGHAAARRGSRDASVASLRRGRPRTQRGQSGK